MLSLAPRRSELALQSVCARPCCLHPWKEGSASGVLAFRGHLWVHFCYGPVTCSPSQGWLCQLASSASFPPHGCNPSYGALTFTPVGLSPTEHASLDWTHSPPARFNGLTFRSDHAVSGQTQAPVARRGARLQACRVAIRGDMSCHRRTRHVAQALSLPGRRSYRRKWRF